MGNCCRARSCEQFFKPSVARRSLETYRRKGLDKLERQMIASVSAAALEGVRVLEIGGGIGRIQAELLATGADQGEVVELVGAYEPYARELAHDTGVEGRTSFRLVDILDEPDAVEPADIVVLNRVVCCSPDGVDLAAAAARLARRTLVLSFPRDVIWVRAGIGLLNASFRLRRSPFRAYVHQPDALLAAADSEGLHAKKGDHGAFWQWVALERERPERVGFSSDCSSRARAPRSADTLSQETGSSRRRLFRLAREAPDNVDEGGASCPWP